MRWIFKGSLKFDIRTNADTVANRNIYSNYSGMGYNTAYGTNFGSFSNKLNINSLQKYFCLHENGEDTYLREYKFLRLRIRN